MQQEMDIGSSRARKIRDALELRTLKRKTHEIDVGSKNIKKIAPADTTKLKKQQVQPTAKPENSLQPKLVSNQRTRDIQSQLNRFRKYAAWPKIWDPTIIGGVQYNCPAEFSILKTLYVPGDPEGPTPEQFDEV